MPKHTHCAGCGGEKGNAIKYCPDCAKKAQRRSQKETYKKRKQAQIDLLTAPPTPSLLAAHARLRSLPEGQQDYIAAKYYSGNRPWQNE